MAARAPRGTRRSLRDAARPRHRRAPYRPSRRARVLQLVPERDARDCRRAPEGRDAPARLPGDARRRRQPGTRRGVPGGRPRPLRRRAHPRGRGAARGAHRARGGHRHPGGLHHPRHRAADVARPVGVAPAAPRPDASLLLRRDRADRRRRLDRHGRGLEGVAVREGRRGLHQLSARPDPVRGLRRRGGRRRQGADARLRALRVLRGLHADRGDGAARTRDARVRPDAPRRPDRPAHRAAPACLRTAPPGRRR